ncbi:hypothetical protein NC651_014928 [Populus alba x Populus x berolinensis]|nr:hypothetical protein NC651_014928 [Populus alba x Populus x berolinensis]
MGWDGYLPGRLPFQRGQVESKAYSRQEEKSRKVKLFDMDRRELTNGDLTHVERAKSAGEADKPSVVERSLRQCRPENCARGPKEKLEGT